MRTYNYKDGRVKDHRVGTQISDLPALMQGELLDEFIEALSRYDREQRLEAMQEEEAEGGGK